MTELIKEHPLHLRILIAGRSQENLMKKLAILSQWSRWFSALNFRLEILLCGRAYDEKFRVLCSWFSSPMSISFDPDFEIARMEGVLVERPVFGRKAECTFCSLMLYDENGLCFESRRISEASLTKLIDKALSIQTEWLKSRIPDFVDRTLSD